MNVKQVSQGRTLYSTLEANTEGIMPKIKTQDSQGSGTAKRNSDYFSKMYEAAADLSNVPIFENDQIMEAVGQYLDLTTLKTQFIRTKENSEFNQLLRLQNFLKQKKSTEIAKTL